MRRRRPGRGFTRSLVGATLFAVAATACGSNSATAHPSNDPATLVGKSFTSTSVSGTPIPGGGPLSVAFPEAGRISATAGCNRHMGRLTVSGDTMSAGDLASTMMACPPPRDGADAWLSTFLTSPVTWKYGDSTLTLTSAGSTAVLTEDPPKT
ncbi:MULTISPECIES: META domain-containing protein [unclassified Gordonia (in: high G+C Gram-positive bacteria)]